MKKKVAIFPAGSEIGLEINNALKYSTLFEVLGLSSVPCHAEYVYANYIEGLPYYTNATFIDELNRIIDENNIDFIYPAYDDVQLFLTRQQKKIHAKVVTSDLQTVEICRSKQATYDFFKDCDFIPKSYKDKDEVENYPVFVKPDVGQGSEGAHLIENSYELEYAIKEDSNVVICEYLPGEEYTMDCFTDKDGTLRVCRMRNRKRIRNGISVSSERLEVVPEIYRIAQAINNKLDFSGAWFFQMKKNVRNEYRMLEIAPRIAGTMGMSRNTGVNFPLLTLFTLLDMSVNIIENNYKIKVDRALISRYQVCVSYDTVYVDLDDTLIVRENVNTILLMFLYQCVNQKKKIILLTKHAKNVEETLRKYQISKELFQEIIWLKNNEEKSEFIINKQSIFIDDSFCERKRVSDRCSIPVFDCSEVEALIDWCVR